MYKIFVWTPLKIYTCIKSLLQVLHAEDYAYKDFDDKITKIEDQTLNFLFFSLTVPKTAHTGMDVQKNASCLDPFINVLYFFMTLVYSLELSSRI